MSQPTSPAPHNIDVFSSGGGSDGPRRHMAVCLTCGTSLSGVLFDYDTALTIAGEHRVNPQVDASAAAQS
jgi:hypothetical protein